MTAFKNIIRKTLAALTAAATLTAAITLSGCTSGGDSVLRLALSTSDGSTSADRTPSPWLNRSLPVNLMYRSLFISDSTLEKVSPDLALSYTLTDGGTRYAVELKDGLRWSDGAPLTADDVIFSVNLARESISLNPTYAAAFSYLSEVYAEGNCAVFVLKSPYRSFIYTLAQFAVLPEHCLRGADPLTLDANPFWLEPVTSGMYAFGSLAAGSYFTLVPNEHYEKTAPKIPEIHVSFVTDVQTAALAGECDLAVSNSTETVEALTADGRFTPYLTDTLFYKYLIFNIRGTDGKENTAMQNVAFRRALSEVFDRAAVAGIYPGSTPLTTGDPSDSTPAAFDVQKARDAVAASGYDLSRPLRLCYYSSDRTTEDLVSTLVHYLENAGLKTEVFLSNDGTRDLFITREYDIALKGKSAFSVDEWYSEYLSGDSLFSAVFGGTDVFDEAVGNLFQAQDSEGRRTALENLRSLEHEYCMKIPLFTVGTYVFVGERLVLPEGTEFGNPSYLSDVGFEKWEIRT